MKKKLKIYSTLLLLAVLYVMFGKFFVYETSYSTSGLESDSLYFGPESENPCLRIDTLEGGFVNKSLSYESFEVYVKPQTFNNTPMLYSSTERGKYAVVMQKVQLQRPFTFLNNGLVMCCSAIVIIIALAAGCWIIFMAAKIIGQIRRGNVFAAYVARNLEKIGYVLAILYFVEYIGSYILTKMIIKHVSIAYYDIVFKNDANSLLLIFGLSLMTISQVILMGKELKDESDLTV